LIENLVGYLAGLPKELITAVVAMTPIAELRGAIPWALSEPPVGGGLGWRDAYVWAVIGNVVPVIPLLLALESISNALRGYALFDRFFAWLFERTRRKSKIVEKYGPLGLALFVGIPLPLTGAWTGCVAAFLFGIRFRYAFPAIVAGVLLAGVVVTLAWLGVLAGVRSIFTAA
jgi:uncharacterized membrane protein